MQITKGNGATIDSDILEVLLYSTIRFGQSHEINSTKNPAGANYITSSHNDDSQTFNASVLIPVTITNSCIIASDYLTGVTYTLGNGGTLAATNWVDALIKLTLYQWQQETNTTKNPEGRYGISWRVESTNTGAQFNCVYTLPTVWTMASDGAWSQNAAEYLLD